MTTQTNHWNPVVKLKRLTQLDFSKYMISNTDSGTSKSNKYKASNRNKNESYLTWKQHNALRNEKELESELVESMTTPEKKTKKQHATKLNRSEIESMRGTNTNDELRTHMTRSKTQKISDNTVENKQAMNSKRKSDVEITKLTRSKKAKSSEVNGLPATTVIPQIVKNIPKATQTIAKLDFKINEIVWGKIRGSSHWPAKIVSIDNRRYKVEWFNDYRTTNLFRTQLYKFESNFHTFAQKFSTSIALETAAKEALICLAQK